jgi:tetratricopeptide (TPR) repeat protein
VKLEAAFVRPLLAAFVRPLLAAFVRPLLAAFVRPLLAAFVRPLLAAFLRPLLAAFVAAFLSVLALAGCATPPATPEQKAAVTLARALRLTEIASPESLTESAHALASSEVAGLPKIAALASLGADLFKRLYPEMVNPFPADTPAPADGGAGASDFFANVVPAFILMNASARLEGSMTADLMTKLEAADTLNVASVLPPFLEGLLLEREEGATAASSAGSRFEACLRRAQSFYPAAEKIAGRIIADGTAASELPRLERLAATLPTAPLRFAALARAELAGGQPQRAADAAAQGLLAAPDELGFLLLRAQAFEALGDWYQSLSLLDTLLKLKPGEAAAAFMQARLIYDKERNGEEAISILVQAEGRFPSDPSFPELRGRILLETGRSEEGVAALARTLSLEPGRVTTLTLLLKQEVQARSWNKASALLAQIPAKSFTPEHLRLGWQVATSLGDYERAIAYAEALQRSSSDAAPLALLARSMVAAGRTAQAMEVITRALPAAGTPALRSELYVIRSTAGSDDPLRDLRSALLEDPNNVEALIALSDILASQQEYRKAMDYAKHALLLSPGNAGLSQKVIDLERLAAFGK